MTVSRITTFVDGNILTGAQLNNEFDNVLTNGVAVVFPATGPMNFSSQAISNMVLENLAVHTASTVVGRIYVYTPQNFLALVLSSSLTLAAGVRYLGPNGSLGRPIGLIGSLSTNIGSFAAQGYDVHRAFDGVLSVNATSSFDVNTRTVGPIANGRDQAAVFASTDVHFYAITTGYGSTAPQGLCSSTPPPVGPTLPTNYQNWAYLCSAKYNVATSAVSLTGTYGVRGSTVIIPSAATILTNDTEVLTSVAGTAITSRVPAIATHMEIQTNLKITATVASASVDGFAELTPDGVAPTYLMNAVQSDGLLVGAGLTVGGAPYSIPVMTNPPALYSFNTINTGTSATHTVNLFGYKVPNGDV